MRPLCIAAALASALILYLNGPLRAYSGGSGTAEDPYQLAVPQDIIEWSQTGNGKYFVMTADIDLAGMKWHKAVIRSFHGTLEGGGFTIRNLVIEGGANVGFFGLLHSPWPLDAPYPGTVVRNLGIVDANVVGTRNDVSASGDNAGILAGTCYRARVFQCYSTGMVSGEDSIGGLIGYSTNSEISNCFSLAAVSGDMAVGGLLGHDIWSSIRHCYSMGSATGHSSTGGLIGYVDGGDIHSSFSAARVEVDPHRQDRSGGLFGFFERARVNHCIWDVEACNSIRSARGVGLTTAQMKDPYYLGLSGWAQDPNWVLDSGVDYPRLAWEETEGVPIPPPDLEGMTGRGTRDDPYIITTAAQFALMHNASLFWDSHLVLGDDIDLSAHQFDGPILTDFWGTLDGAGHTIHDMNLNGRGDLGLAGLVNPDAAIRNLGIVDANVQGVESDVGILAGQNRGHITCCFTSGTVSGKQDIGGLIGSNYGRVENCYSMGQVSSDGYSGGGLVGSNKSDEDGKLMFCYSTCRVNDVYGRGGLTGWYSPVDTMIHCMWDIEVSGQVENVGGLGLRTEQMMDADFLSLNGWGGSSHWILDNGRDYPRLAWEDSPGEPIPEPNLDWIIGAGTSDHPYQIGDANQVALIHQASVIWDKHFVLTNDIDLAAFTLHRALIQDFYGSLDGQGYCLRNLKMTGASNVGFIGRLHEEARVRGVGIIDADITGSGIGDIGILVGRNMGQVTQCFSTGQIAGSSGVGGLVGDNLGILSYSHSQANVTGQRAVGGLAGANGHSVFFSGLHNEIHRCYSTGAVSGVSNVGGFVGGSDGSISQCYSTGSVTCETSGGGFVGFLGPARGWGSSIVDCYSKGGVTGQEELGGFVGFSTDNGDIIRCYSTGGVSGITDSGGFAGKGEAETTHCFWDLQSADQATSYLEPTGLSTEQMQNINTYLTAGWDFINETDNGTDDIWYMPENDYPHLSWELPEAE